MTVETFPDVRRDVSAVLTTGTFDGVHLGHAAVLRYVVERARAVGGTPTLVTFDPHPREVLGLGRVDLLTTVAERARLAGDLGVERVVVVPFTRELSELSPDAWVRDLLLGAVGMREIVVGYDHHFGHRRAGTVDTLRTLGDAGGTPGFSVDVVPQLVVDAGERGLAVSSTRIRDALRAGDAAGAAARLGRAYALSGEVARGAQRGRTIGFPTANLAPESDRLLVPADGVYATRVQIGGAARPDGGAWHDAMTNVGTRPTVGEGGARSIETHVLDFAGDLYGRRITVAFHRRLRDERRFDGLDALAAQLREDAGQARQALFGLS